MNTATSLAPLLERFFTQRLMQQRQASPHTIRSYRDTFRQFLVFAQQCLHQPPSRLTIEQIVQQSGELDCFVRVLFSSLFEATEVENIVHESG